MVISTSFIWFWINLIQGHLPASCESLNSAHQYFCVNNWRPSKTVRVVRTWPHHFLAIGKYYIHIYTTVDRKAISVDVKLLVAHASLLVNLVWITSAIFRHVRLLYYTTMVLISQIRWCKSIGSPRSKLNLMLV